MKIDGSTAWRSITQSISDRSLSDALAGLRHVELANECLIAIPAERDGHQSNGIPAPARDIHRAGSPCLQALQRQITLRSEAFLTSPSMRICPTTTWNGFRLARCFARGAIWQPIPASATQNRPMTGLHPSSDCSSDRFKALSCPLLIRGKCIFFIFGTICYINPEIAI